ncbi:unnamed protein product [Nyctereutes procyonoides]|uniref:(raccoon dog) hypothetical protein n=1 Tax=Nyctereutes procyonoides TaxID=34880 RepID=A0A811ZJY0_NYCPR|nr:unnamed protein product [Nyctereutes procyonoides]
MEAEKSHDLPSESWRTRKISGILKSESKGLIIGGPWYKFQSEFKCPRARSTNVLRQKKMNVSAQRERVNSPFLHLFVLFKPSTDWMMPIHIVRVIFIT